MKPVDNPSAFIFRADIKPPPAPSAERKKTAGKSFLSLFRPNDEAEKTGIDREAQSESNTVYLEEQLDLIHEVGQKLLKHQTLEQVQAYKTAIKSLMQHFLRNGIESEELISNRNVMNQKKYTIIRIIDEKLERLVTGILQSQVKQMEILSRLEEIQGLLINLVH